MNNFELPFRLGRSFVDLTIAAVISFALSVASATTDAAQVDSGLEGKWSGKIQIPGEELVLIVDLAHGANWTGSVTLPALNLKGAPLIKINVEGADVSCDIQALTGPTVEPPKIKARLADTKLVGNFIQGGNTAPLVLEKAGPPQVEEPPPSTPVAKEFEGEWKGDYELLGYPRKVTLKLQNHGSQPASAEFVIVGRKLNNLPVDRITQQGNFITIESTSFGMTYEGRLENGEIHGTVLQGPIEIALTLHRPK
jgi:hypothetical protein